MKNRNITHFLITLPGIVLYTFFFAIPVIYGLSYSFTNWNGMSRKISFVVIENYLALFSDPHLMSSFRFTTIYTILLVIITILISLILALLLNRKMRMINTFRTIFFFPAVLSLITVGLIWDQIYYRIFPYFGGLLNTSG